LRTDEQVHKSYSTNLASYITNVSLCEACVMK